VRPEGVGSQFKFNGQSTAHHLLFKLVPCTVYSTILQMEAIRSSETSDNFQPTTWCYIQEEDNPHNHRRENFTKNLSCVMKKKIITYFELK
jgi:hypothetical protein